MRALSLILGLMLSFSVVAATEKPEKKEDPSIGTITEVSGIAVIKRNKTTVNVTKGTPVETDDKVETKAGRVKITFKDNTTILVTESSSIVLDTFVYDPKSKSGKLGLKSETGTVRYTSGNIAHNNPNAVKINTPTAAIAVRGTDFVMSVNESGGSMIMLMPTCESEDSMVNLKGTQCSVGAIDVSTDAGKIFMTKAYQATVVETSVMMPSAPVIVNLNGAEINNSLLLSPPQTSDGQTVIQLARNAALKTGDLLKNLLSSEVEIQSANSSQSNANSDKTVISNTADIKPISKKPKDEPVAAGGADPHVFSMYKDVSYSQQVGWVYERTSDTSRNYSGVVLPIDTKVQMTVTQDNQKTEYNFNGNMPAVGSITIIQNYR